MYVYTNSPRQLLVPLQWSLLSARRLFFDPTLVLRFNTGMNCLGAGVRLGGHIIDGITYGVDNQVSFTRRRYTARGRHLGFLNVVLFLLAAKSKYWVDVPVIPSAGRQVACVCIVNVCI